MTYANAVVSSLTGPPDTAVAMDVTYIPNYTLPTPKDGAALGATFWNPQDITTDGTNLYVTDTSSNKIRKIIISSGVVSSLTGATDTYATPGFADGSLSGAAFNSPAGITTDGGALYVIDSGTYLIRKIQ
jgi:hypothetical protein